MAGKEASSSSATNPGSGSNQSNLQKSPLNKSSTSSRSQVGFEGLVEMERSLQEKLEQRKNELLGKQHESKSAAEGRDKHITQLNDAISPQGRRKKDLKSLIDEDVMDGENLSEIGDSDRGILKKVERRLKRWIDDSGDEDEREAGSSKKILCVDNSMKQTNSKAPEFREEGRGRVLAESRNSSSVCEDQRREMVSTPRKAGSDAVEISSPCMCLIVQ